jgi:maltose/maltodextrin transport system permease protein
LRPCGQCAGATWGRFAALVVLSGVPITVMFLLCQKYIVGGLTSGGVEE